MISYIREAHKNDKTTADEGNVPTVESVKQLYSKAKTNPTVDTVFDIGSGNRKNPLQVKKSIDS